MKVDKKKTNLIKVVLCTAIGFYAAQLMAFTPTEIAGLELWLDAADSSTITTTSVGRVSQWSDKSGKDKHATQTADASRPMYVSSVTNGLPGIHFDSMFLNTACVPATGANPRTLIAVVANIGQNGINYEHVLHYGASSTDQAFGICSRVSGTYVWGNHYWGSGFNTGVSSISGGGWIVISDHNAGVNSFYINGQPPKTNTKTLNTSSTVGVRIGAHVSSGEMAEFDALEIMAFSTALPVEDRQKVEGYLAHKWGMAGFLPLDHPYKGYAPGGAPEIANEAASGISLTSATINGGLVSTGTAETAVIAYWGETDGGTDASAWANTNQLGIATQEQQSFSVPLTGLAMGTTYYYRFAATNDVGLAFAPSSASFTTLPSEPQVANGAATDVLNTSAMISGTVTYLGAPPTTLYAFWATNDCGTDASAWLENGASVNLGTPPEGSETAAALTGLTPNTVYYYNFMASNDYAMAWGTTNAAPSFRTPGAPELSGVGADLVMDTTARLNATLDDGNEARVYFIWGTAEDALVNTNDLGVVPMGDHYVNLTGLSAVTTYYFQTHAENTYGSVASSVGSFVTIGNVEQWTTVANGMWTNPATWNVPGAPRAGATVTVNHAVTLDVATPELSSVTVNSSRTLTFDGWYTVLNAAEVTIAGTMTHTPNTATTTNSMGQWVPNARVNIACSNMTLTSTGRIDVNYKGYRVGLYGKPGSGPGGGDFNSSATAGFPVYGHGGGHGGHGGGVNYSGLYGLANGVASAPENPGSGGGGGDNSSQAMKGHGGGAVRIDATGTVTIGGGGILANGEAAGYHMGSGSGGSVYITCLKIEGGAVVQANGGSASTGGSGGRIAVIYDTAAQQSVPLPTTVFSAAGGYGSNGSIEFVKTYGGEVGTLYFPDAQFLTRETGEVKHSGKWVVPGFTSWSPTSLTLANAWLSLPEGFNLSVAGDLTATGTDIRLHSLDVPYGDVTVGGNVLLNKFGMNLTASDTAVPSFHCEGDMILTNSATFDVHGGIVASSADSGADVNIGGALRLADGSWIYPYSHPTNGGSPAFTAKSVDIAKGTGFDASRRGYMGGPFGKEGFGPGRGKYDSGGGGGGYGGAGGGRNVAVCGTTNGLALAPLESGSGGAGGGRPDMAYHSTGGKGGGEVRISATTSFNLDGSLLANGGAGWGWNAGGGSGGSIFVDCFKFTGTTNSVMSAKGNDFSGDMAGSSGGGRIAVWYKILPADRVRLLSGSMESVQVSETYDGFLGEADVTPGTKLRAGFVAASPGTVVFLTKDIPTLMLIR